MTLLEFEARLTELGVEVYEGAAPAGSERFIVWQDYSSANAVGDGAVCISIPIVQLDIVTPAGVHDELHLQVKTLLGELGMAWTEIERGYDDEWMAMRCILQLAVD